MSQYTSDELFHFVGRKHPDDHEANYRILGMILASGWITYPPDFPKMHEQKLAIDLDKNLLTEELVVPYVTCYCDIPLNSLEIHMRKYGWFGFSFSRDYLAKLGARPVIYIPWRKDQAWWNSIHGRSFLSYAEQVYRGFKQHIVEPVSSTSHSFSMGSIPKTKEEAAREMDSMLIKDFFAYIKPFNVELTEDDPDNFYMEREWRKYGPLEFRPDDVHRILVSKGFGGRLQRDQPSYASKVQEV